MKLDPDCLSASVTEGAGINKNRERKSAKAPRQNPAPPWGAIKRPTADLQPHYLITTAPGHYGATLTTAGQCVGRDRA